MTFLYQNELNAIKLAKKNFGSSIRFRQAHKDDIAYLKSIGMPESVLNFYAEAEPTDCIEINYARLWPISELRIENQDAVPGYIVSPLGFLVIGTTIEGDIYCIDTNSVDSDGQPPIVMVSHDEVYEGADEKEIKAGIVKVSKTFCDFLKDFSKGTLPTDFYELNQ
ncbi:MAG: hypothetical protein GY941_19090 [Planctomycetes bacterium]|nr:hypothetical protein [Planctomycetota bacterium]